ncbi:hypothetical protein [Amycolatopsis sp. CA-128772]|uniref:hypothetical protein n=1 Tax=Amycolatopsis sp. CA-128772 TaxID=2073159 RepID=UPI001E613662|nr:hypothetical protein [Amycolatopsis sp. CA-128772]
MSAHIVIDWLGQIPNPTPVQPEIGGDKILGLLNNVKWGAGVALILGFFVGLIVWVGGRWVDHHRAGKVGVVMMLCAVAGAILYGIGWSLINSFAGG